MDSTVRAACVMKIILPLSVVVGHRGELLLLRDYWKMETPASWFGVNWLLPVHTLSSLRVWRGLGLKFLCFLGYYLMLTTALCDGLILFLPMPVLAVLQMSCQ